MTIKKFIIVLVVIGFVGYGGWRGYHSVPFQNWLQDQQRAKLPAPENIAASITAPAVNAVINRYGNDSVPIPDARNLAVPFTSQAPHANWDADHEEFCEEAAVLMVGRFYQQRSIANADDAENGLQQIKQWEVDHLGFYFDTTAAETAQILEGLYNLHVDLKVDPTIRDIKLAIAQGQLVIVPAAGRELGNPNFTAPGPIYHNLVIRGYTADGKFITNDPGTRKGEEYVYDQDVVMGAMHDWVPSGVRTTAGFGQANGRRVVLIVSPA